MTALLTALLTLAAAPAPLPSFDDDPQTRVDRDDSKTPWIGIKLQDNRVVEVLTPSPSQVAGLEPGDEILSVDGVRTPDAQAVARAVRGGAIGELTVVRIARGDKRMSLAVFLAERLDPPQPPAPAPSRPPVPLRPLRPGIIVPSPNVAPAPAASSDAVGAFSLANHRGRVVVIQYMTTWCGACRSNVASLNAWQREFGDRGLDVLTVSSEDPDLLQVHKERVGIEVSMARDVDGRLGAEYRITKLPTFLVFDREGRLAGTFRGARRGLARAKQAFVALLDSGGEPSFEWPR